MPLPIILAASALAACPGLSVHDGDTIRCGAERIRISDIMHPSYRVRPGAKGGAHPTLGATSIWAIALGTSCGLFSAPAECRSSARELTDMAGPWRW
jgi:hypothetical protein